MIAWLARAMLGLVLLAAVAGCTDGNKRAGDDRFGGFYGGLSGGVSP